MVPFDIKSMLTNVPLNEVLNICLDQLYDSDSLPPPFQDVFLMICHVWLRRMYNSVFMISCFVKFTA